MTEDNNVGCNASCVWVSFCALDSAHFLSFLVCCAVVHACPLSVVPTSILRAQKKSKHDLQRDKRKQDFSCAPDQTPHTAFMSRSQLIGKKEKKIMDDG